MKNIISKKHSVSIGGIPMIYEMTQKSLAEYLSNTKIEIGINGIKSSIRERLDSDNYGYAISVKELRLEDGNINPKVDCFLNYDGSIYVEIKIPSFNYRVIAKELDNKDLEEIEDFDVELHFKTNGIRFGYKIKHKKYGSYLEFYNSMKELTQKIEEKITRQINRFIPAPCEHFCMHHIMLDIKFNVNYF